MPVSRRRSRSRRSASSRDTFASVAPPPTCWAPRRSFRSPDATSSDRACSTPEEARAQRKTIVMIQANIHAGEVEGKESVLALLRDLTLGKAGKKILSKVCLVVIPDLNPDGNDRISPENRKLDLQHLEGQENPPGGVGTRNTGEGWNLNRDYVKQDAPE